MYNTRFGIERIRFDVYRAIKTSNNNNNNTVRITLMLYNVHRKRKFTQYVYYINYHGRILGWRGKNLGYFLDRKLYLICYDVSL